MGNQLVGIAPSQIFPVEHYLSGSFELDLQYEISMGSTRFFKVARARSEEGLVVVKVFVKNDPTLPLEIHAEKLEHIKKTLSNAVNCLPFQKVVLTDKAGLIMREYVKHSLYDRVSTRPFLQTIEKKWITFQILCALHQCHKQKICHGDIKLENILITSWNWILLSDFASFKPTYLPEDNPADYTYFFDTSRRRTCYIAPERFVKSFSSEGNQSKDGLLVSDSPCHTGTLLPEMDIFSAGCALLELWTEGTAPFEFSQLLSYRSGEQDLVTKHLEGIENEHLKNLLSSMLNRNPKERKSAELYLDQERGRLFPEYFYSFLQSYMQMFSSFPIMPPDDKIMRLHQDISQIITILSEKPDETVEEQSNNLKKIQENDGLIIITTVTTSCIRGLHHCNSKLCCLEILNKLAECTTGDTILDRILPYILYLAHDSSPRVRVNALDILTMCLCMVKDLPRSDANIFPEYILPTISALATDNSTIVRTAYAKNIATLAETAVRFLEQSQIKNPSEMSPQRYETELTALQEMLQQTISSLLADPQAIVKQTLVESGITKLCVFFGRQKANVVILSHMITFLNDKEDKNLRGSFFDCIVGVAAYVGWQCSDILIPLLQQGLTDPEEFVIAKAIRATTALTELGLLQKPGLIEYISECACYLNHPNLWIRHEVCGLISTAAIRLSPIDVQCKIMPVIIAHLKSPLIQVEKPEMLLDCLHTPIPRHVYDNVIKFEHVSQFLKTLQERKEARAKAADGVLPQYGEMGTSLRNFFRRLANDLNEQIEKQLLSMKFQLIKINKYKLLENRTISDGILILDKKLKYYHELSLLDINYKTDLNNLRRQRKNESDSTVNSDWHHMFSAIEVHPPPSPSNDSTNSQNTANSPSSSGQLPPASSSSLVEYSMPERTFVQERFSECRVEFDSLKTNLKNKFTILASSRNFNMSSMSMPSRWKPSGLLVAHLHEHKAAVTKMTTLKPLGNLFASVSVDGTVKLWDCNKLDGHQSINRSRQFYHANTPLYSVAACDSGQSLAVASNEGTLLLLRIDPNSSKMPLQQARHLDSNNKTNDKELDGGSVVDMHPLDQGAQSVIVYATLYGSIVAWDIRMPGYAWRLENDLRDGVITTFCIDPTSSWLAVGTSSGKHICWDLRFKLPIANIYHPAKARIRKIACHPTQSSWLISASQGNNEVSVWNIETQHRQQTLWASTAPALSNANTDPHSVCTVLPGLSDQSGFLLTAGSDQRIRFWDLNQHKNCSLVVPSAKDFLSQNNITYESRLIDGTQVIQEIHGSIAPQNLNSDLSGNTTNRLVVEEPPRSGPEPPSPGHHDIITDLLMCKTHKQNFVASSSRDGVIKLWK